MPDRSVGEPAGGPPDGGDRPMPGAALPVLMVEGAGDTEPAVDVGAAAFETVAEGAFDVAEILLDAAAAALGVEPEVPAPDDEGPP